MKAFRSGGLAAAALNGSAALWIGMALIGQWAFLYYIAVFYGPSTLSGDFQAWSRNIMLTKSFQAGDTVGNVTFGAHALLAGVIAFGGVLQVIPQVRARWPRFHRWNGRVFLVTALGLSLSGLYLIWVRGNDQSMVGNLDITLNGLLILTFAGLTLRTALARNFVAHRRWALRLFLVSNAQWFVRVGFFAWLMGGALVPGGTKALNGAFFAFWSFGCYLVPLAVLELYLRAKDGPGSGGRWAMAGALTVATLVMGAGMFGFALFSQKILSGEPVGF